MVDTQVLELLIEKKDISISELSRRSGVAKSTLSELMTGKRDNIRLDNLTKIAKALEVSINFLIK